MVLIRKTAKIAMLVFGLLPFILFAYTFVMNEFYEQPRGSYFTVLFILTAASIPGALILYVADACRNKRIVRDQKYLWIALLVFANVLVYPFYWYLHVWREPENI